MSEIDRQLFEKELTNAERAEMAKRTLATYFAGAAGEGPSSACSDFLANLHHLCDTLDIGWEEVLSEANSQYEEDMEAPDEPAQV